MSSHWELIVFFFSFLSVYFGLFLAVSNEVLDNRSLEEILGSISPPPPPAMTNEAGAPRLMITHIVNQNFKSYAGEQTLGPFHKVSFFYLKHFLNEGKTSLCDSIPSCVFILADIKITEKYLNFRITPIVIF